MEESFTIEEFLIGLKKIFDYLGPDKLSELIKECTEQKKGLISNEEILERIRRRL